QRGPRGTGVKTSQLLVWRTHSSGTGGGVDSSHKVITITLLNQDAQVLDVF
ncbi:hypothetical protein Cadr_000031206, partial [Camelus dromedarius]